VLGFSIREGDGEQWSSAKLGAPRYFCYWESGALQALLEETKFSVLDMKSSTGFMEIKRLYVIARKAGVLASRS
jgi:hypothetical protein